MRLENRLPAEGINASHEHPLQEFVWLLGGIAVVLSALVAAVAAAAQWVAPRIPFEYELKLTRGIDFARTPPGAEAQAVQAALQALADRLAARMDLPAGMQVRVAYSDSSTVNAMASLGGQTVVFRGLLAKLGSEDALAMVLAHEIAHLKLRHPAASLGRGVAVGLMLSVVSAELGRSVGGGVLSQAGMVTLLRFNRDQEREADAEALRVLAQEYGHLGGAVDLFEVFAAISSAGAAALAERAVPELLRTHPLGNSRSEAVRAWAHAHAKALEGPRRPLPPALAQLHAKEAVRIEE